MKQEVLASCFYLKQAINQSTYILVVFFVKGKCQDFKLTLKKCSTIKAKLNASPFFVFKKF